jgi:protein translocase SecG subunit
MFKFFLVVHAIIAASLVGVILMQRSEGGGLAGGGSPSGLMTARGAADFLTRTTTILATLFVGLSIVLALLTARRRQLIRALRANQLVRPRRKWHLPQYLWRALLRLTLSQRRALLCRSQIPCGQWCQSRKRAKSASQRFVKRQSPLISPLHLSACLLQPFQNLNYQR